MDLKKITEECLQSFPLYDPKKHEVRVHNIWIGYRTTSANQAEGTTHFDLNICGDILYLLNIEVAKEERGKGHGDALYKVIEEIGRKIGCHSLYQTPSGWTTTGETRANYLKRRGYQIIGSTAIKVVDSVEPNQAPVD